MHICANDKVSLFSSYSFDAAVMDIFGAVLNGATLCPIDIRTEDLNRLSARLNEAEITIYHSTPTVYRYFVNTLRAQDVCPSVRLVVLGGEEVQKTDFELYRQHFSPLCLFVNGLGPTESTISLQYFLNQQTEITHDTVPVGYAAVENTEVSLFNEAGEQVALYGVGEIIVKSPHVALGYWRRLELTHTQFSTASADGYWRSYRTGDLGRWLADGTIEYVGRRDNQVKIRGHRVELGEVEAALRMCPGVSECAVVMRRGENGSGERLVAYVVMGELEKGSVSEWRQQLEERLPQYMVPPVFLVIDKMPMTASGKVNRRALPEVAASRAELEREYEAPRTETEEMLVSIWREVLQAERVGVHDNFFELGGHSLLATRMVSLVRESFQVEVPLRSVFESPTVAGLAARVETMMAGEHGLALPAIERVERVGELPLSYAQQRLWFLDQFEPERAVYNISHCFQLSGTLEVAVLERALTEVLRRHESLRTNFVNGPEGPVQVISPATKWSIAVEDLQGLSEAEREMEVSRIAAKQAQASFDLSMGPLIRVKLVRLSSKEHLLWLTLHHIVCDGWSIAVLMQELVRLYQGYSKGEAAVLEELPVQYADYAAWQRQWLQGSVLEQQVEYWKQQLAGAPAVLSLPTDRARPPRQTFKGGRVQQSLTPELSEQLQQLSQRHGVTLFMTLLAGFQLLLGRYSGQEDVVVGTPIANRTRRELEGLIGFFANTLVMRTELSGDPSFAELLERVREVCLGAYQHQDLPFEKLVEELQPERSLSHSPIFQVMFILQNNQAAGFEQRLGDLQFKTRGVETEAAKFDLTLSVAGLSCSLEYNTDLFNAETAERLVRHWINVLQAVSADPAQRISEVPLLSMEERQQLLSEWNPTAVEYAREKRVHELIAEQSALRPEAIAVICQDESLNYAELNGRANQLARYLQGLGVGPDTVVGICMERSVVMMVGLLAVLKAGAAYLPLDPDYPAKRLEFMMADSQAPVLLTQARLQSSLTTPEQTRVVQIDHDWAEIAVESAAEVRTESEAGNLAYVIYTSGSTGEPKGVMISHGNVMNFVVGMDAVLGQKPGVWLAVTSISFDISVLELLWTLARGYEVVIDVGDKDSSIAALVARHEVTHLQCTPSLLTVLAADGDSLRTLSSLDALLLGGEALPTTLARQLSASSPATILNMYGPTETTIWSSTYRLSGAEETVPIGRAIANTQLYVLDQHLSPVPVNVAGELYIGGEGVVRGYQQRPELTASRFIPDPFSRRAGARLYRTGDVARFRADGLVEYLGRADQQLKLRGYRIELGEIEAVLGTHAAVRECVVVAHGEADDMRLVAYVVMQSGESLNESELRQHAGERLPQYMVPSVFKVIEKMPLTPNGKVNRRALPAVEASRAELAREYEGPRTETEETLVSIWQEVLKVERVSVHDNFFELGGHSLLAARMVSRVRESFSVELALRSVFESPTVAGLAAHVETILAGEHGLALPAIERVERVGHLPLSYAQQRLWFLTQLQPENTAYNMNFAVRLTGPLDLSALEHSFNEVVRRHEALRTSFVAHEGKPIQVITSELHLTVRVVDLSDISEDLQAAAVERRAIEQGQQPFDLTEAPLLRLSVLRFGEEDHVALFTMHHIISDAWSLTVLLMETAKLYQAFHEGQASPLPPLPIQYADFAVWQRAVRQEELLEAQLDYWQEQLAGASFVLDLPTDRPRLALPQVRGATKSFVIDKSLSEALAQLSRGANVTLFMTLLAAFQTLLYRYTGQEDILVGTPIAGRNRMETEQLIGFFADTLVVRTRVSGDLTFRELLARVREVALGAYSHQEVPFERLVKALQPERNLGRNPIFQVLFALQNTPVERLQVPGLVLTPLKLNIPRTRFDLSLDLREEPGGIGGVCEYNADLFDAATIESLLSHYRRLLESVAGHPEERVAYLPLLAEAERRQLLREWNSAPLTLSNEVCLHELFERQAELHPNAVAVVYEEVRLSYGEVNRRANQLAHYLRARGVGPDVLVGLSIERSVEMLIGLLGILKAGGAYVPLDPAYPKERLDFMLRDSGVALLVTMRSLQRLLPENEEVKTIYLDQGWIEVGQESEENLEVQMSSRNLAYMIYTSGSTGRPKGVQVEHESVVSLLAATQPLFDFGEADVWTVSHSYAFDFSVWEIWGCLLHGGRLVIVPRSVNQSPEELRELLREERVTVLNQTPSALRQLSPVNDLALRLIVCGGEALPREVAAQLPEWGVPAWNFYGPTEATVWATINQITTTDNGSGPLSIGRPLANTQVYVLDSNLQLLPVNVAGELYIGGAGVARGYYQRSELTAERFVPDAYSGTVGGRLYRTGDRVRYGAEGKLEFLGRADQQLKLRGYRIELGEIEAVLGTHAAVHECVVVAQGEADDVRLVAYVVLQSGESLNESELRQHAGERLPQYMVPSVFQVIEKMPLTPNGKVNRRALPAVEASRSELSDSYVEPRTETEALVCSLWAGILKLERVGIYDNFFELGGHSLLATRLMSRIRETFQVEIPLRLLFEQPTVAGLTQGIEAELAVGRKSMVPLQRLLREGPLPLSFSQRRLWFLDQLTPGSAVYNIPVALRLNGSLHLPALQQAFTEILRRQESLRTRFAVIDADPVQLISEPQDFDLHFLDLSHLERTESEQEVQRLASEEANYPFDLTRAPLFRATLLRLAAAEHVLLFTMHHIVSDGWSMGILIREITTLYEAFAADRPSPLVDLPVQYADYALWQREQLQGERLEEQLQYWREQLQGAPALLELPTEKPRPPVQSYRGAELRIEVTPATTRALRELSQQHGVTLFMTLLAAFQALLYRYTGQDDIVVGTPVAGRTRAETEGLIGFFLNTLALRVSLKGDPTFATLLSRVREACLGAYAHQDVPFEQLLEELAPERTLSHTPVFQVMFNMLNLEFVGEQTELDGLTIAALPVAQEERGAKFELELYARERGEGLQLILVHSELYTSVAMERMLDHLHTLLQAVAAEPGRQLAALDLSTNLREQHPTQNNLIRPTNPFVTFADEEIEQTIQERFEQQVRSYPENIAIKIGKESWTYKELNYKANQIARAVLAASGDGDERIALLLNHDAWMVAGILGVLKAGKTYVPLDPSYPAQRLIDILDDSEAAAFLTDNANLLFAEALNKEGLPVINLDRIDSSLPGDNLQVRCAPDSLAYILYTSGSTGKPKGVVQNHRNVLHHIRTYTNNLHICAGDKLTLFSSYAVDAAVQDIFGAVLNGATVCPIDVRTEDLNVLLACLNEAEITIYHSTPTVYRYFVNTLRDQDVCSSVRLVVLGGEEVQKRDFELYRQHFSPLCLFVNGLGLTESTVTLQYFANQQTEITHDTVPVGYAAADNTEISLFNEAGEQVALYGIGEIIVKSPHVALGYWRQRELTEKAFPTASADGYWRNYRTGDLGRWLADGTIEYVGRRDNQVKIRGHRVELGEVEAALRTCRGVSECAVVMRRGENGSGERLVAYVVMGELEKDGSVSEWRQQLEERLPQYMVPSVFLVIDKMPMTASGKIYRRGLPEVEASRAELGKEYEEPRNETEELLVSIWREVLNVERVGIHDNFFALGGHSLLATRMVSLVRESFQVEVPLRSVFETPTIAGLSVTLIQNRAALIENQELEELIAKLEQLSEEEAQTILDTQVKPQNLSRDASA
ncbi:MAG TPA: amino acid adenylation domain-containing protein [Pyrinomonadaceae bacterium]|nr:amino acid adenylation domain-containing protein [Pyrinomonadaceae bacterium]